MSLEHQQREFLDRVLARAEPADARMAIYHRGGRANRLGALAAAYPVVRRLVGPAFFEEAGVSFGLEHPSRSGDLNVFGAGFAEFLAAYPHARDLDYLADVARLEWAVHEASRAPQGEPLDYAALGSVPPAALGSVRLRLRPSVRLVASPHPVLAIWEANLGDRDGTPARSEGPDRVAVRRAGAMEPVAVAVGAAEWTLLQAFARGENLAQAAAACSACELEFEPALAALGMLGVLGGFERDAP